MSLTAALALVTVLTAHPSTDLVKCSEPGVDGCTLRVWMKQNAQGYLESGEYGRLAWVMRRLSHGAPPSEELWRETARAASRAAEARDPGAVRAQCRACHETYRLPRGRPLGPQGY